MTQHAQKRPKYSSTRPVYFPRRVADFFHAVHFLMISGCPLRVTNRLAGRART